MNWQYFSSLFGNSFKEGWKILLFLCLSSFAFSQEETKEYEEVEIKEKHQKVEKYTTIDRSQMERLAPHDLGHLLQYANGVTLRDYGGLGGMKTVSIRGMGGQHTRFISNGLPVYNAQNGQTDFGLVQIDNFENLAVEQGVSQQLLPVSAIALGNTIVLQTFENTFSNQKLSVRAVSTAGSFGQREVYGGIKTGGKQHFIATSGKYRRVRGDYPYEITMGNTKMEGVRRNNAFDEYFFTLGGGFKSNGNVEKGRHKATFIGQIDGANKELPGAVILYNDLADQTLRTENQRGGGNYHFYADRLTIMAFGVYNRSFLHYHDPSFLNQQGYLDNQYINHNGNAGVTTRLNFGDFGVIGGTDMAIDRLESNRDLGSPGRLTANNLLGMDFKNDYFSVTAYGISQFFEDHNRVSAHSEKNHRFNPQISIETGDKICKDLKFYAWYKQTLRAPSFNELYYSQIGNLELDPEEAQQFNMGANWNKSWNKFKLGVGANAYYNSITNKILALPTKNLFVWSITNVGEVDVYGADFQMNPAFQFNKDWQISGIINATYQEVVDRSDENSPTYGHQIAYTPKFSGTATASIHFKNWTMHHTLFGLGERFSLNQNIPANSLSPFALWDASLEYCHTMKEKHTFRLQVGVRNMMNNHYNFIRYFVMPGRNYFIKLMYEI